MKITKGQTVSLSKAATDAGAELKKLVAGGGWDAAEGTEKLDLDLVAVYLGEDGKAIADANGNGTNADEALTFFGNAKGNPDNNAPVAGALHLGDNRTGDGDGDDEQIEFTLADVPANVKEIAVALAIYEGADNLGSVKSAFVRLVNADGNTELGRYDLDESYADTKAVELGRVVRNGSTWEFKATGTKISGSFKEVLESYGVTGLEG